MVNSRGFSDAYMPVPKSNRINPREAARKQKKTKLQNQNLKPQTKNHEQKHHTEIRTIRTLFNTRCDGQVAQPKMTPFWMSA